MKEDYTIDKAGAKLGGIGLILIGFIIGGILFSNCPTCPPCEEGEVVDTVWVVSDDAVVSYTDTRIETILETDTAIIKVTKSTARILKIQDFRDIGMYHTDWGLDVEILEVLPSTYDTTCYRRDDCVTP